MKKLIILFISVMLVFNMVLADSLNPDLEIASKRIVSCNMEKVVGTFEVKNNSDIYNSDIYYIVSLNIYRPSIAGKEYQKYFKYYEYDPVKVDIGAKESKNITFEYDIPDNIPFNKYSLSIQLYDKTTAVGYDAWLDIGYLGSEEGFIDRADYEYWKIGKEIKDPLSGPNISKGKVPVGIIELKSNFEEDKTITPTYTIYKRNQTYEEGKKKVYEGDGLAIKAGEKKKFEISFPLLEEPESYLVHLTFVDDNHKQVSGIYEFRYVVVGASAKILSMNSRYDEVDDKIDISINVIGPADLTDLEDVKITYKVYNSGDNTLVLQKEIKETLTKEVKTIEDSIDANAVTGSFDVLVEVSHDNKVLATMENKIDISKAIIKEEMFTDLIGTKYLDVVKILNGLNILNGYPDGTFKPANPITRAEFTVIATKLAGLDIEDIKSSELKFNDVNNEHWAKNFIILAYENNIISGYPDGTFKPDNNVTYQESLTILLNVMGYKWEITKLNLAWPQGYIKKASELNMMSEVGEVDYAANANRGGIALLTLKAYLNLTNKDI